MARTVEEALSDVMVVQRGIEDSEFLPPAVTEEQWEMLGDRCVRDAIDPRSDVARYADSINLAAVCYANATRIRELRANNWNEPRRSS